MSNGWPMCDANHCSGISQKLNETCKKNGWPENHLIPVCNPDGDCCTCTCSCLAFDTPVLVPGDQRKAIQDFKVGDMVVAFNPDGTAESQPVEFSNGTSAHSVQPEMAYVGFKLGDGSGRTVVVTLDHTFLAPDGRLIRASMVRPGAELVLSDGQTTTVDTFEVKGYVGGVWSIATSLGAPESLDGHLIDTNGILSGDYAVQLHYEGIVGLGLAASADELPEATTRGHDLAAGADGLPAAQPSPPSIGLEEFVAGAGNPVNTVVSAGSGTGGVFLHHDHSSVLEVPAAAGAQGYLTQVQADEIAAKFPPSKVRGPNDLTLAIWLKTAFSAFYPDIRFVIDAPNRGGNAYAFNLGDQPYVLVQGGLIRAVNVKWEGLALILGCSVSRLTGDGPTGPDGLTCKAQADYAAVGILANVFYPLYGDVVVAAYSQIKDLFSQIEDKADSPVKGCHPTALDCRVETYAAAMQYLDLPQCAGGPKPPMLEVTGAAAETGSAVEVSFSDWVDVRTADQPANYAFEPDIEVGSVAVTPAGTSVKIEGEFKPGTEYVVTVDNVKSIVWYPLDPEKNSAQFTMD